MNSTVLKAVGTERYWDRHLLLPLRNLVYTRNMREEILRLRSEGKTYNQIKIELGCSLSTISYYCGVGQKTKTLGRTRNRKSRKLAYVQEYKQGKFCEDCKETYPYWILEFDHL